MNAETNFWMPEEFCLRPIELDLKEIAQEAYKCTCRTSFDAPGFCVINFGNSIDSVTFRQMMVDLKSEMANLYASQTQSTLIYLSAARFDQQESTKPHLDGGPDQSLLMLGYEPSEIASELEITDYARCAFELGLTPKEFLAKHNPMFKAGYDLLRPYVTRIPCFSPSDFQIVLINNSSAELSSDNSTWQGVLHTATILEPDETKRRIINSTMLAPAALGSEDAIDSSSLNYFIHTSEVRRRGYDKPHLEDD